MGRYFNRPKPTLGDKALAAQAKLLRLKGMSIKAIARHLHIGQASASLLVAGVEVPRAEPKVDRAHAMWLRDQGYTLEAIAKTQGVHLTSVVYALNGGIRSDTLRASNSPDEGRDTEALRNKRASLEHLLDLKRAGYRGGFGELRIPATTEFAITRGRASFAHPMSHTGSTSAMCAEG